ncbi:hypothetical protein F511_00951 [Dorcoceras hygrometricum]|uniref:Uncharacterized protein n=1 Tax=Dorcoceras hygrometricum TaxID=472368 RepID=A0A2Z7ALV6_9LAMI|nr:hypothetical protein F511_00951 [Dorcoceras hygrometricum]
MANFHARSNSFPSSSHPVMAEIQDQLYRLKGLEATSTSDKSAFSNLATLVNLQEALKNLIQIPTIRQALSYNQFGTRINEILEGSLRLVDLCGFSREVVCLTKESLQELESSIRRNRGETATANDVKSYLASRKNINKVVNKYIRNLKSFNQNSTALLEEDNDLKTIIKVLKEMEAISTSVLKSVLLLLCGVNERSKQRNWVLLSKFTPKTDQLCSGTYEESGSVDLFNLHNIRGSMKCTDNLAVQKILKKLKESEMTIHELEDGLEALFRSLVKTRVSLLNILSDN